jgi:predicted cation transporter
MNVGLMIILVVVLLTPFLVKQVERNLEPFLLVMGLLATICSGVFGTGMLVSIFKNPFMYLITLAVLISSFIFLFLQHHIRRGIIVILRVTPVKVFIFLMIVLLGLLSSMITAIVASLLLVEMVNNLPLKRSDRINLVIITCFAIGLGAILTPMGEPLSAIVASRLHQGFWYMLQDLGFYIIPGIIILGLFGSFLIKEDPTINIALQPELIEVENYRDVLIMAFKVFVFICALELLGAGFKPLIDTYLLNVSGRLLYWINMISAILDNATLAAAEISTRMNSPQITAALMGLLISGGMLIPGNIPNIISSGKLNISSREWARLGIPLGLILMFSYALILTLA